jgi:RNA polymerase sigma-70 factor, ECF subfamily
VTQSKPETPETNEAKVVRNAMSGDQQAFGLLVRRYQQPIYNLCCRYVGDISAEDCAQETFVRAFVHRSHFDPKRPPLPWLLTIARRLCIDLLRRRRIEPISNQEAADSFAVPARTEETAAARQELRILSRAFSSLKEGPREAVALYHLEGLTYQETADVLKVPLGTVMTWLHRGRTQLRATVAEHTGETQDLNGGRL